ncbi:MAG: hypothetical protein WDW38_000526 [Sanguina aurantia]
MDTTLWNTLPPNLKELCVESFDLELECYAWNELEDSPMYGTSGSDVSDELFVENTSTESTENNSGTEVNGVVEDPGSEAAGGSEEESDVQVLSHLRHMAVSRLEADIPVECLAAAVSLAPNLETAIVGSAAAACMTDPVTGKTLDSSSRCLNAIAYLDKRMRAGLTISAAKAASNTCAEQSFALHLHMVESSSKLYHGIVYGCPKERVVCGFLDCLPACATMTRLAITTAPLELERQMDEEDVGTCEQPHQYTFNFKPGGGRVGLDSMHRRGSRGSEPGRDGGEWRTSPFSAAAAAEAEAKAAGQYSELEDSDSDEAEHTIPTSIARAFPNIKCLHLAVSGDSTHTVLDLHQLTTLEALTLANLGKVRGREVVSLCAALPRLRRLSMSQPDEIKAAYLCPLESRCVKNRYEHVAPESEEDVG